MPSLKEIRGRILSVKETLKITSAMRMISSAKLQGAQNALNAYGPYVEELNRLYDILAFTAVAPQANGASQRIAVVLVTSNQSLCGSFNANITREFDKAAFPVETTDVFAVGKFGMKAARRQGYNVMDCCSVADKADYNQVRALSERLEEGFGSGLWKEVIVISQHLVSRSTQTVVRERLLPFDSPERISEFQEEKYIFEPSPKECMAQLLPEIIKSRFYLKMLDAKTAEHAARALAMQIATDNADRLLAELSLAYNKQRQQQITNEILALVGGQTN